MRYFEIIEESPQEIAPSNFNLDNVQSNQELLRKQLPKTKEVIETTPDYDIIRTGDFVNGWIILHNKKTQRIDFLIQYKAKKWGWLPASMNHTVTQCLVWRRFASVHTQDLAQRLFFNYLLNKFPAIMSDYQQTPNGNTFWFNRMANAHTKGLKISVANIAKHTVSQYNEIVDGDLDDWLVSQDAYGPAAKYQQIRYIISK